MKKRIDGRRYDTQTATKVSTRTVGDSSNDLFFFEETLYRKRNGEFFLLGEGGAGSRYAIPDGDFLSAGWDIVPLTEREMNIWVKGEEYYYQYLRWYK